MSRAIFEVVSESILTPLFQHTLPTKAVNGVLRKDNVVGLFDSISILNKWSGTVDYHP